MAGYCDIELNLSTRLLMLRFFPLYVEFHCSNVYFFRHLQGSRLTAFELVHDKIPATLVADSAAAALMKDGRVDAVIVGADRVAANGDSMQSIIQLVFVFCFLEYIQLMCFNLIAGDTANKIGTYSLALCAMYHNIPFYVAAPLTSIDLSLSSGKEIVIEERSPKEMTHTRGGLGEQVAASGISVWNPAFDVTPANLITGIVTEKVSLLSLSLRHAFL